MLVVLAAIACIIARNSSRFKRACGSLRERLCEQPGSTQQTMPSDTNQPGDRSAVVTSNSVGVEQQGLLAGDATPVQPHDNDDVV